MILSAKSHKDEGNTLTLIPGEVKILFVVSGKTDVFFSYRNEPMVVDKGKCITLFNANQAIPFEVKGEGDYMDLTLSFKELHQMVSDDPGWVRQAADSEKYYSIDEYHPQIVQIHADVKNSSFSNEMASVYLKGKAFETLTFYMQGPRRQQEASCPFLQTKGNYEKVVKAKHLLVSRLKDPYTVSELAREIGVNDHHLTDGFKEIYGTTINKYFQQYRLQRAKEELSKSESRINEVAENLGYASTSHFIETFKRRFGMTPKKFQSMRIMN
jgi:AraC-like DNA-binding protein